MRSKEKSTEKSDVEDEIGDRETYADEEAEPSAVRQRLAQKETDDEEQENYDQEGEC